MKKTLILLFLLTSSTLLGTGSFSHAGAGAGGGPDATSIARDGVSRPPTANQNWANFGTDNMAYVELDNGVNSCTMRPTATASGVDGFLFDFASGDDYAFGQSFGVSGFIQNQNAGSTSFVNVLTKNDAGTEDVGFGFCRRSGIAGGGAPIECAGFAHRVADDVYALDVSTFFAGSVKKDVFLSTEFHGTGGVTPNIRLKTNGNVEMQRGSTITANSTTTPSKTGPHLFAGTTAGAPTGVPADTPAGRVALNVDTTNDEVCFYDGGWVCPPNASSHIADTSIHYTQANIDHTAMLNIGANSHAAIDTHISTANSHIADTSIHYTQASIDHLNISNIGTNSHAAIDTHISTANTHIADTSIHFTEAGIDHTAITNIGVNSHAAIDTHIANSSIHGPPISVEDEGTPLTTAVKKLNFAGAGVTVTEPVADEMLVTITGGGGGEANTASNQGAGVGVFDNKNGVDLEMRSLVAASTKVSVSLDAPNKEIDLDVNEANIDHDALSNFVAAEHVNWAGSGAGTIHTDNYIENATHTGEVTGSGALTVDPTAITNKTTVAGVTGDFVLVSDTSDAGNLKKVDVGDLLGGAGAHASTHIDGGSDPVDGDKLEITYSPTGYTPDTSPVEVDTTDDLTAHLSGIGSVLTDLTNGGLFVDTIQTVGNGFNTIRTLTAGVDFQNDDVIGIEMDCVGIKDDGSQAMGMKEKSLWRKDGAAATVEIGTPTTIFKNADDNGWNIDASLSGSNILLQVDGNTGDTVQWKCRTVVTTRNATP